MPTTRHKIRQKFNRGLNFLRGGSRDPPNRVTEITPTPTSLKESEVCPDSISKQPVYSTSSNTLRQTQGSSEPLVSGQYGVNHGAMIPAADATNNVSSDVLAPNLNMEMAEVSMDLWSAAYREAIDELGADVKRTILKRTSIADLFHQLEQIEKDTSDESIFLKGVRYLQSLRVPLEKFKLALDLASPLTSIEPTTSAVFGVVRSVTAIAISFSTADLDFAKQIGEMLEQMSYIDDCDTLGQKMNKTDIHKVLISVYRKLLEFYTAACNILTKKGPKLVITVILDNGRLPAIVADFLKHAEFLKKIVQNATFETVADIGSMLFDREIKEWLGAGEKINRQTQQHAYLRRIRADQACEFLLSTEQFINWWAGGNGSQQLAIIGEMGSGNTVAMAFLIDELRRRNEHQFPQPKICYHYCYNDEAGQAAYIYSVLILFLLDQLEGLKRTFYEWYKQKMASLVNPSTDFEALEEWLHGALETIDRPIILVIDGLDECDEESRNFIFKSLSRLSHKTPRFKILYSSRPEESILEQLNEASKISMSSNTERDGIIAKKTVETNLSSLPEDTKALVETTLARGSQGSAIWIKMMADLIKNERIKELRAMKNFLREIPQSGELFELYSKPLSILEIAWAANLGCKTGKQGAVTTVDALAGFAEHGKVLSLIQPFVVHLDFSDLRKRQVKLVHQSVKEFVIKQWADNQPISPQTPGLSETLEETDQQLVQQRIESLEANMADIYIRYLLLQEIGDSPVFSEEILAIDELPQETDLFDKDDLESVDLHCTWEQWEEDMIRYDPTERGLGEFFVYASCYWIEHVPAVSARGLLPHFWGNIERLCLPGSTRLSNWITQNSRPDCTVKPRFEFDPTLYDPLGITALYGSDALWHYTLEHSDFNDKTKFLPNPAWCAADQILRWGELGRIKDIWDHKEVSSQIHTQEFFRLVATRQARSPGDAARPGWDAVFQLADGLSRESGTDLTISTTSMT